MYNSEKVLNAVNTGMRTSVAIANHLKIGRNQVTGLLRKLTKEEKIKRARVKRAENKVGVIFKYYPGDKTPPVRPKEEVIKVAPPVAVSVLPAKVSISIDLGTRVLNLTPKEYERLQWALK